MKKIFNSNDIADSLYVHLVDNNFVPEEDVAWVAVTLEFLNELEGEMKKCSLRDSYYKRYKGIEFRQSQWATNDCLVDLKGKFAWNITKRTRALFTWSK